MMRLESISVEDFRSIRGRIDVELDAPIVLIHGQNGAGKTSLLSAIELALTGRVPSLERADANYVEHLVNRDSVSSQIRIHASIDGDKSSSATIDISNNAISGANLLPEEASRFYSERCFLAQSTLGRLLELYENKHPSSSDSPLTKFVKDLLGLDYLDALIDGLHDAGHVARLRNSVSYYWEIRDEIPSLERNIDLLEAEASSLHNSIELISGKVHNDLANVGVQIFGTVSLDVVHERLSISEEEKELQELTKANRLYVDLVEQLANSVGTEEIAADQAGEDAAFAAAKLEDWKKSNQSGFDAALFSAFAVFPDLPAPESVGYSGAIEAARDRVNNELARCDSVLTAHSSLTVAIASVQEELGKARERGNLLDLQILDLADEAGQLSSTLMDLLTHTDTEICPVCDRDYGEVPGGTLRDHVSAKINNLSERAGRLQALSGEKAANSATQATAERNLALAVSQMLPIKAIDDLRTRRAGLVDILGRLDMVASAAVDVDALIKIANDAQRKFAGLGSQDRRNTILRESVAQLLASLKMEPLPDSAEVQLGLERANARIVQATDAATRRQDAKIKASISVQELSSLRARQQSVSGDVAEMKRRLSLLAEKQTAADMVINEARELVKRVRNTRTTIVTKVFNEELNKIWRDLFVRLAPEEPFIPAFVLPNSMNGPVEAVLQTRHRSGSAGGNPRAMLSAGNLNTAALTLFLALHLSVDSSLPWLVIDDPVQSMDEVHIAQFAALLRVLSKVHNRQIIVAVHEKPLFDYLALELSPAFQGDRLITLELARDASGKTLVDYRPYSWQIDAAIAA